MTNRGNTPVDALTISQSTVSRLAEMLAEDIGTGDVTTALFDGDRIVTAEFRARSAGVMCGFFYVRELFLLHDSSGTVLAAKPEGEVFAKGDLLIRVTGTARTLLEVERTALNLFSRLCGISTRTKMFVDACLGASLILDTRKTTPLLREFEKYAVATGGGKNHRMGLYDMVLVKDNHITLLAGGKEAFCSLVSRARAAHGTEMLIEIEVDTMEQFGQVLAAMPDIILLDNMSPETMREAVAQRDAHEKRTGTRVLLEASGGIRLDTVAKVAGSGVDRISAGCLTYDPVIVDIGLDFVLK